MDKLEKRLRRNRVVERSGVNASRAFFEEIGCTFVEVDLGNDYGKDAYVDVGNGETVSAICAALQIKAGPSYKTTSAYKIPADEIDISMWRESTIPIIGIVFDLDDKKLRWVNISDYLARNENNVITSIPVHADNILSRDSIKEFSESIRNSSRISKIGPITQLCDENNEIQCTGVYECFLLGRTDYRFFVGIRHLLPSLHIESRRLAIKALGHLTPHPDIYWTDENRIPKSIKKKIHSHFIWSVNDVLAILEVLTLDELERGQLGLTAFMLLIMDPNVQQILYKVAIELASENSERRTIAILLLVYLAGEDGSSKMNELLNSHPQLIQDPLISELQRTLDDHGSVGLF